MKRTVSRVGIWPAITASVLFLGLTVTAYARDGDSDCRAAVYVDGAASSEAELRAELATTYERFAATNGSEAEAYEAVARIAATGLLVASDSAIHTYRLELERGAAEMLLVMTDEGWIVDSISVPAPDSLCDPSANRSLTE